MDWEDRYQTELYMETFLAVREACIAILWPTPGFKGRKFHSSGIGDLNFYTHSMPLQANKQNHKDKELARRDIRKKKKKKKKEKNLKRKEPLKLLNKQYH